MKSRRKSKFSFHFSWLNVSRCSFLSFLTTMREQVAVQFVGLVLLRRFSLLYLALLYNIRFQESVEFFKPQISILSIQIQLQLKACRITLYSFHGQNIFLHDQFNMDFKEEAHKQSSPESIKSTWPENCSLYRYSDIIAIQ